MLIIEEDNVKSRILNYFHSPRLDWSVYNNNKAWKGREAIILISEDEYQTLTGRRAHVIKSKIIGT